ncbi:hypothetical protein [Desulfobacula phenolica]|uniref:Lipoprotein n=1 Tax=Desulfobacula phenolica TaxID=90732 RepID=A0A1H2EGB7_9BACT|nr:hypothetical protein [Desulfobacula phenolica]SDT94176.1 hypothetical protein SAMN04487931_10397 [Desulfobacula phenolica]
MKIGIFNTITLTLLMLCACVAGMSGCRSDQGIDGSSDGVVSVPHGYVARLEQVHDGRMIGFGPFVGYYFRPDDPGDLSRLRFVCFNENRFYSSDMPDGAKLYEGTAVRTTLPMTDAVIPVRDRINPVFFHELPKDWLNTRPEPGDEFVHFHSCYNGTGSVLTGYWIRHVAVSEFTYDMGGRVGKESPLYHRVRKGPDRDFASIVEFDRGPEKKD